ncbi:MAG: gamma-glutamyl-gamma-aminobutyrate hydrolase family protein [Desulfopila sp.]|jgi:putative glutamine amidotransferase|nr:gamma-glutamyl-gamma-aminobutyrate hydrolase family protein [Desulfopila sp.]
MAQHTQKNLSRPLIGVTGNSKWFSPSWVCIQLAIFLSGGKAVRIQVGDTTDMNTLSALIISGGDDIHPTLYGDVPKEKGHYDRKRDAMEIEYIHYALRTHLPLLGICRGLQLINTVMGGTLHSSIAALRKKTSNRRSLFPGKRVYITTSSSLGLIVKEEQLSVNSLHDQAIAEIAAPLRVAGVDNDQIIQAVEAINGEAIIGVQWHPEYLLFLSSHRRLFRWLVAEARLR